MRILDLFCGGGGAAAGYVKAGHSVYGVDIDPQPSYLGSGAIAFVQMDALAYLVLHGGAYDFIHASPPCQPYSKAVSSRSSKWNDTLGKDEPALIPVLQDVLERVGKPYVIENVRDAIPYLHNPMLLCGSMFGLDIPRHRFFESSIPLAWPPHDAKACRGMAKRAAERRGWDYRDMTVTGKGRRAGWSERASELMGITHPMRQHDLKEAIPPAYTEWIGRQL